MTTIIRVKSTGDTGVLVGTGFGTFRATRPGMFWGNLIPREESGQTPVAAVADADGKVRWVYTEDMEIVTVDGVKPGDALAQVATA